MDTGVEAGFEGHHVEQEAKQRESNMDVIATGPSTRQLTEENFMQYMQMMQDSQNKFMEGLVDRVGQQSAPQGRGVSLSDF